MSACFLHVGSDTAICKKGFPVRKTAVFSGSFVLVFCFRNSYISLNNINLP